MGQLYPLANDAQIIIDEESIIIMAAIESRNLSSLCQIGYGDIMGIHTELESLVPPQAAEQFHAAFLEALWDWVGVQLNIAMYCVTGDSQFVGGAAIKADEWAEDIARANDLLNELVNQ